MRFRKLFTAILLCSLTVMSFYTYASQHDMDISTGDANTGVTFRSAVNSALQALVSQSSGASEPSTMYAYQIWADTTADLLKIRNAANNAWITLYSLSDPSASLTTEGFIELATDAEVAAGVDTSRAVVSSSISALLHAIPYAINEGKGDNIASAWTTDIGAATGNWAIITGVTTINSLGVAPAGAIRRVEFSDVLTISHSTSILLPGNTDIKTANEDEAVFVSRSSGIWSCVSYTRDDGYGVRGLRQIVNTQVTSMSTGTTAIPFDNTVPQITEGDQYMTLAITPKSTTNTLKITVVANVSHTSSGRIAVALFQDATANALAVGTNGSSLADAVNTVTFTYYMTAGTTSATTFRVRAGHAGGATTTFNGYGGAAYFNGTLTSSITIEEYSP